MIEIFNLPLPPTTNSAYANRRSGGRILTEEARVWKQEAGWIVKSKNLRWDLEANYKVEVVMFLKRDRDIDGSLKLLLDALSGVVWEDDSQVVILHVYKFLKHPGEVPHLGVEISPIFIRQDASPPFPFNREWGRLDEAG